MRPGERRPRLAAVASRPSPNGGGVLNPSTARKLSQTRPVVGWRAPQDRGALGKIANCQVAVTAALWTGTARVVRGHRALSARKSG